MIDVRVNTTVVPLAADSPESNDAVYGGFDVESAALAIWDILLAARANFVDDSFPRCYVFRDETNRSRRQKGKQLGHQKKKKNTI